MAKGKKTGGRDFQKGNPGGRPIPGDIKSARALNKYDYERLLNEIIDMSVPALVELRDAPTTDAKRAVVASILVKAHEHGDAVRFESILERLIGPVPKEVNVGVKPFIIRHRDGKVTELGLGGEDDE